jgi:sortase A
MTDDQPAASDPGANDSLPMSRREAREAREAPGLAEKQGKTARPTKPAKEKKVVAPPAKRSIATRIIGVFGELLITVGILVLLFLGWQLWWNSIVLGNQQAGAATSLSDQWQNLLPSDPAPAPTTAPGSTEPDYGVPPVMAAPGAGADFAILYVPRFGEGYKRTISQGIDPGSVLNKGGAGHYPDSQMPGEVGNFAIAAHRDGWGSAFININELHLGDAIYVETQDGWYTYRFRGLEYVTPFGVGVIDPIPQVTGVTATDRLITLTSCNPLYIASERIIGYGAFESWQPRSAGAPTEIAAYVGTGN